MENKGLHFSTTGIWISVLLLLLTPLSLISERADLGPVCINCETMTDKERKKRDQNLNFQNCVLNVHRVGRKLVGTRPVL